MGNKTLRFVPFALFLSLGVFFWFGLSLDPHYLPSTRINKPLPHFQLPQLRDEQSSLSSEMLSGHISLLNVWASWCEACTEEQLFLLRLAQSGIAIYGLNYKDSVPQATKWLNEWGNPYKLIGEDFSGKVAIELGVYGAPETFLIDKQGVIRYRHVGILTENIWKKEFLPLINHLKEQA